MANPVALERSITFRPKAEDGTYSDESILAYREVRVWCQGCVQMHPFRVETSPEYAAQVKRNDGTEWPTWTWNGDLEKPTFSPSLLCYSTVHLCEDQHEYPECHEGTDCDDSHGFAWEFDDGTPSRTFKVWEEKPENAREYRFCAPSPHPLENPWGNCHTFLTDGVWDFLGDCGHDLRGQHPLQPFPDHCLPEGY